MKLFSGRSISEENGSISRIDVEDKRNHSFQHTGGGGGGVAKTGQNITIGWVNYSADLLNTSRAGD